MTNGGNMNKKELQSKITKIWNHTELDLSNASKEFLLEELVNIGNIVNDIVDKWDEFKICSACGGDKLEICEPCIIDMSKQYI